MDSMDELRKKINETDDKILALLNRRARLAIKIGKSKSRRKQEYHAPHREEEILNRLTKKNSGPFPKKAVLSVFREIMSASLSLERPIKVAFLGPEASFTHQACIQQFGQSAIFVDAQNIEEVFEDVDRDRVDYGVVPVENSNEGVVSYTLDMFIESQLRICAEILLEVSHNLLSTSGRLNDVKVIYSHSQAIAQCRNWIQKNLSGVSIREVSSTAHAARLVLDDKKGAAIASKLAATLYKLRIIKSKIEDNPSNYTRFLVIGKKDLAKTNNDKTSLMFSIKDEVGSLFRALRAFDEAGINLSSIKSRPIRTRPWEYIFFVDIDAHVQDDRVKQTLMELEENCIFLKILGSYPKGRIIK